MQGFEILGKLGEGAYSNVYKVRRKADDHLYALKQVKLLTLNDKERANALNEVRLLASVKHPNVVSYKESFFDPASGSLWYSPPSLIMELADSGDLYERILEYQKRGRYMSEGFIWTLAVQITRGLKACHDLMILHRDLKSANVFLWRDGGVKLGDFNVSKVAKEGLLRTQTGTPYYASPEVWRDQPYSLKSDIWSLGCVLYEACALRPPFRAEDMQSLCLKVVKGEFSRLPRGFSIDLNSFISQLLNTEPSARPCCSDILNYPPLLRRIQPLNQSLTDSTSPLLRTIVFPKNAQLLASRLPASAYRDDLRAASTEPDEDTDLSLPRLAEQGRGRHGLTPDARMFQSKPAPRDLSDPIPSPVRYHKQVLRESYGGLQIVKPRGHSLSRPARPQCGSLSLELPLPTARKGPSLYLRNPPLEVRKHRGLKRILEVDSRPKGAFASLSPIR